LQQARAGEAETITAVNAAAAALDDAFERQSAEEIKRMMTADHIAVSSYYGAPQTVAEQIASLPELKYEQTIVGAVKVDVLGPDAANANLHGAARWDLPGQAGTVPCLRHRRHGAAGRPVEGATLPDHRGTALAPLSRDQRMR
jgi:hypothetical protein